MNTIQASKTFFLTLLVIGIGFSTFVSAQTVQQVITRTVECRDQFGNVVANSLCNPSTQPASTGTMMCPIIPVGPINNYSWSNGAWGTCVQTLSCQPIINTISNVETCGALTVATCGNINCIIGGTGPGTQTRNKICRDQNNTTVGDNLCPQPKPTPQTRTCRTADDPTPTGGELCGNAAGIASINAPTTSLCDSPGILSGTVSLIDNTWQWQCRELGLLGYSSNPNDIGPVPECLAGPISGQCYGWIGISACSAPRNNVTVGPGGEFQEYVCSLIGSQGARIPNGSCSVFSPVNIEEGHSVGTSVCTNQIPGSCSCVGNQSEDGCGVGAL